MLTVLQAFFRRDTNGRVKTYEAIVKGANVPEAATPESFKVLVKEIRSLALAIEPLRKKHPEVEEKPEEVSVLDTVEALTADTTEELLGTMSGKADGAELMLGGTDDKE